MKEVQQLLDIMLLWLGKAERARAELANETNPARQSELKEWLNQVGAKAVQFEQKAQAALRELINGKENHDDLSG